MKKLRSIVIVAATGAALVAGGAGVASAKSTSLCGYDKYENTVRSGSSGAQVKQAQCELDWAYAYGSSSNYGKGAYGGVAIDGSFGAHTTAATKAFQKCVGIVQDGIIGPDTWHELDIYSPTSHAYCH